MQGVFRWAGGAEGRVAASQLCLRACRHSHWQKPPLRRPGPRASVAGGSVLLQVAGGGAGAGADETGWCRTSRLHLGPFSALAYLS